MATTIIEIPTDHFDSVVDDVISGGGDGIEKSDSKPKIESELKTKSDELEIDQMKKLKNNNQSLDDFMVVKKPSGEEDDNKKDVINRMRRSNYNQERRVKLPGRASKTQREYSIRRTVYV
ncbi:unnamed protein product [Arabis nemorensis]|uniref:Uncharacterized protein n=1 Tax=Arabis nemorensis TaxID=586526 RepID=A0A565ATF5_9BRAS|nr:unnamed protein product [Arabis nemorensis]